MKTAKQNDNSGFKSGCFFTPLPFFWQNLQRHHPRLRQERLAEQKAAEEAIRAEQRQKLKAEKAEQNARKVQEEKAEAELRAQKLGRTGERKMIYDLYWFMNIWCLISWIINKHGVIVMCSSCLFDCLCMGVCFVGSVELRRRREEREAIAKEREAWYFAVGRGGTEMISFVEL